MLKVSNKLKKCNPNGTSYKDRAETQKIDLPVGLTFITLAKMMPLHKFSEVKRTRVEAENGLGGVPSK